jgi:hypothetical protein
MGLLARAPQPHSTEKIPAWFSPAAGGAIKLWICSGTQFEGTLAACPQGINALSPLSGV